MATLNVNFSNLSGHAPADVSIGFLPGPPAAGQQPTPFSITNLSDNSELLPLDDGAGGYPSNGNWYTLADLSDGVAISSFSGRVYVAYGQTWSIQYAGYEPGQAVTDPNFFLRYDKMEMTFTGNPNDVADLTSIDYWSIPMSLLTFYQDSPVQAVYGLKPGTVMSQLYDALDALTEPPVSGLPGVPGPDGAPLPALVPGEYVQYPTGPAPGTTFARIIGPSSYPSVNPQGIPVQPYNLMEEYLEFLLEVFGPGTSTTNIPGLGNGVIAKIYGKFAGVGSPPPATGPQSAQTYNLTATIDDNLNITLTGTVSSVEGTTTIVYQLSDLLNPSGIYGGNTPYYLDGASTSTTPGNDVYGWIGGDLFAGINIGAVGSFSTVANIPGINGPQMVGSLPSQQWFLIPNEFFFSKMQPSSAFYNQWAAALAPMSDAYNFAFSDRFAHVLVSLNPAMVDTLQIVLEQDMFADC